MERVDHAEIAISGKTELDLNELRSTYGDNFNTLTITNTDDNNIELYIDGVKVQFILGNNGVFAFDWESHIDYNFISIENLGAGDVIAANQIKISVGRTGAV